LKYGEFISTALKRITKFPLRQAALCLLSGDQI